MKYILMVFTLALFIGATQAQTREKERFEVQKSDEEWKAELSDQEFKVLCGGATEAPFTGKYLYNKAEGTYTCGACDAPLFSSGSKFDSGSGWPSFYEQISKDAILEIPDYTMGMKRTEIVCAKCGGHLGHVFNDGPNPTGMRYCVNSVSLGFIEEDSTKTK